MPNRRVAIWAGLLTATALTAQTGQHDPGMDHHHAEVMLHGQQAMGFDQAATTHHFRLSRDGGYVQVQANSPDDALNRYHIRMHLEGITRQFAAGDFSAPEFTHSRIPPGVPAMKRLGKLIAYRYQAVDRGGRVVMSSRDARAISAIHDFLKFQIEDHRTGDPMEVR